MFQRVVTFWRQNEAWLRMWLLVSGIGLLIVETAFPTKAMLAWRETFNLQSVSFMSAFLLTAVCGAAAVGLLAWRKFQWARRIFLQWGMEFSLTLVFFVLSWPFVPLPWAILQSAALGIGLGVLYRYHM